MPVINQLVARCGGGLRAWLVGYCYSCLLIVSLLCVGLRLIARGVDCPGLGVRGWWWAVVRANWVKGSIIWKGRKIFWCIDWMIEKIFDLINL